MDFKMLLQAAWIIGILVTVIDAENHVTKEADEEKVVKVRDVDVEVDYVPVGCFKDKRKDRALGKLFKNLRKSMGKDLWKGWPDMSHVIRACAEEAFRSGYTDMFAVQFYGECFSDKDAESRYNKHGASENGCINGVGKASTNYVYKLKVVPIPVRAPSSVCNVNGQTFKEGDSMEVLKDNGDMNSAECHQCTCAKGKLVDCHQIFHCVMNDSECNRYVKKPGQCCPACERDIPSGAPVCKIEDREYKHGDSMELLKDYDGKQTAECHQCTCLSGKVEKCHRIFYCELNRPGCTYIQVPGQCCPSCARLIPKPAPPYCKVNGRDYKDGDSMEVLKMPSDQSTAECQQCQCNAGKLEHCHHIFHCSLNDSDCARYEQVPGQCCPQCVPLKSDVQSPSCKINGQLVKHGESAEVLQELDRSNIFCQQCRCSGGQHICHKIYECDVQKQSCEKTVKIPGQCCPVCG